MGMANTVINMDNASISNIKDSKLISLLDNLADHQSKTFQIYLYNKIMQSYSIAIPI